MSYPTVLLRPILGSFLVCILLVGTAGFVGRLLPSQELAVDTHHDGERDIYLLDLRHNINYRLTAGEGDSQTPVWSPDGQRLAYVLLSGNNQTIMVSDADGQNRHPLFTSQSGYIGNISLAWSPDSQQLAFTALLSGEQVIYMVKVAPGESEQNIPEQVTAGFHDAFSPTWSPDGTQLAFSWARPDNEKIFVAHTSDLSPPISTTRNLRQLTNTSEPDTAPDWSPDGRYIAFVSNRDNNREIYVMKPDGTGVRRLTYDHAPDIAPTWTPDSQRVIFTSNRTGTWEIYSVDVTCATEITCQTVLLQVTDNYASGDKLLAAWRPQ